MMLRAAKIFVGLGFVMFLLAWISWFFVGGSASSGKAVDGHFYVNHKGRLIEVTQESYTYSLWLERGVAVTFPLMILAGGLLNRRQRKQRQERELSALRAR